jgi:hypothetical protein
MYTTTAEKIAICFLGLVAPNVGYRMDFGELLRNAVRLHNAHARFMSVTRHVAGYVPSIYAVSGEIHKNLGKKAKGTEEYPLTSTTQCVPIGQYPDISTTLCRIVKVFVAELRKGTPYGGARGNIPKECPIVLPLLPNFPWDATRAWPAFHWTNKLLDDLDWGEMHDVVEDQRDSATEDKKENCDSFDRHFTRNKDDKRTAGINREYFLAWLASKLDNTFYEEFAAFQL